MAEARAQATPQPGNLGHARIAGRVEGTRSKSSATGRVFFTRLKMPALDAYSSPSLVEIRSDHKLGDNGDELSVLVNVKGYPRSYPTDDGHGGKTTVQTAENVSISSGTRDGSGAAKLVCVWMAEPTCVGQAGSVHLGSHVPPRAPTLWLA